MNVFQHVRKESLLPEFDWLSVHSFGPKDGLTENEVLSSHSSFVHSELICFVTECTGPL